MTSSPRPPKAEGAQPTTQVPHPVVRAQVRDLLLQSPAFLSLPAEQRQQIARDTALVASYLAKPEGIDGNTLPPPTPHVRPRSTDPYVLSLGDGTDSTSTSAPSAEDVRKIGKSKFQASAAREGAAVAGLLLKQVNFPTFVAGLIKGVFHSIVESSIEQMEAYGALVANVAKTLNQFRDENTTDNQGVDHLVDQFPDVFKVQVDPGDEGGPTPRARLRDNADEEAALKKVNSLPIEGGPVSSLDDDTIDSKLVPAARTQLATSRQQLLATMVLMGINRIVVTDGRISAKILYDFQARDTRRFQRSAASYDYDKTKTMTTGEGEYESQQEGGEHSYSHDKDSSESDDRDASYYAKGKYKYTQQPVLNAMSAASETTDAALQTKAQLAGSVDVNFKSDYFPLEKMADSFQNARIQDAAKPGQVRPAGGAAAASTTAPAPQPGTPAAKP
jgi:hypothetical protein